MLFILFVAKRIGLIPSKDPCIRSEFFRLFMPDFIVS